MKEKGEPREIVRFSPLQAVDEGQQQRQGPWEEGTARWGWLGMRGLAFVCTEQVLGGSIGAFN